MFSKHHKGLFKDGCMSEEVLDDLFNRCLPKFAELAERGMLTPDDYVGVTDMVEDGVSMQAYAKAKARAVTYAGAHPEYMLKMGWTSPDQALPILMHSHDEACAAAMDAETTAWVREGEDGIRPKNSGNKIMAAQMISIWGTHNAYFLRELF